MSWEAWGTPDYLDQPVCETCCGSGFVDKETDAVEWSKTPDREQEPCPDCDGNGCLLPPPPLEDDVI